ncbi:MAG TPA: L-histidine N(alpha)-methyltransferase [Terracidiphilus sp.]|jgi:dimethylhistidine N-methyltransferase
MTTIALPAITAHIEERVASAAREGLGADRKRLPPWLFYDQAGSRLFEEITELPEYYLTRTERGILAAYAGEMVARAAEPGGDEPAGIKSVRLRIAELGAGSADKTRLLLKAAVERQGTVLYEPVDVSASALAAARERIEREIAGVTVATRVMDYTHGLELEPTGAGERRLVLYIGSSIGNFEPREAVGLLERVRAGLRAGDGLLLGVDLVKDEATLLAAYDDSAGVTAAFNLNLLTRLNRELGADFDLESFEHRAVWNGSESRIEMHLESRIAQRVRLAGLDFEVDFGAGESIHTENSYKYAPGQAEAMLAGAGFVPVESWTDERGWFGVCLGRAG